MPVIDTYSRRKKRAEQGEPDVYHYDQVPSHLRIQVRHILNEALGTYLDSPGRFSKHNSGFWLELHSILLREMGRLSLCGERRKNPKDDILDAVTNTLTDIDDWLTVVELCFLSMHTTISGWDERYRRDAGITQDPEDAIEELNARFRHACLGYQFEADQIVRVDSQYLHSEVVKPALKLLGDPRFAGAQEEFHSAHAHYRAGEYEDAIHDANRAFESTMKAICDVKGEGWEYSKGARASDLIKIVRRNGLLPDYLDQSFDQLISTLQSGLPRVRNDAGGHGQGALTRDRQRSRCGRIHARKRVQIPIKRPEAPGNIKKLGELLR